MEGEQRFNIPLDSPLDINSNDMLVPAAQPKFAFNRQKYLGSLLQTSVRYEANGYFAGWWGHNFDIDSTRDDYVEPPLNNNERLIVYEREATQGYKYYLVQHTDIGLQYNVLIETWENWIVGSGTITRAFDEEVEVVGITALGDSFTATVNPYTGTIVSFNAPTNPTLYAISELQGNILKLTVDRDLTISTGDYIELRLNHELIHLDHVIQYTRDANISYWDKYFSLNDSLTALVGTDPEFLVKSFTVYNANTLSEYVRGVIADRTQQLIKGTFEFIEKWVALIYNEAKAASSLVNQSSIADASNSQKAMIIAQGPNDPDDAYRYDKWAVYKYVLGLWMKQQIEFDYNLIFVRTPDPVNLGYFAIKLDFEVQENVYADVVCVLGKDVEVTAYNYLDQGVYNIPGALYRDSAGRFRYAVSNMKRYTEFHIKFLVDNLVTTNWSPWRKFLNENYDPRSTVYDGTGNPYGCKINPDYYINPYVFNAAKENDAKSAIHVDDVPDYFASNDPDDPDHNIYNNAYYIQDTTVTGTVTNNYYQPDPLLPAYDPRPVVPSYNPPTWADISITNPDIDEEPLKNNNNYNATRYYNEVKDFYVQDWPRVSPYWLDYWPERTRIPIPTADGIAVPSIYPDATTIICTLTTDPDIYELDEGSTTYSNEPVDWQGYPAPPLWAPWHAVLTINFTRIAASLHTLVSGESVKTGGHIADVDKIKCNWEWRIVGWTRGTIRTRVERYRRVGTSSTAWWQSYYVLVDSPYAVDWSTDWQNLDEGFAREVYDNPIPAGAGPGWYAYDRWQIELRCINKNDYYPIPRDSTYFYVYTYLAQGFRANSNLFAISSKSVSISQYPSYCPIMPYTVYNAISTTDAQIWNHSNGHARITIPLCIAAYAVQRIKAVDIIKSNYVPVFELETVLNSDPVLNQNSWRFDLAESDATNAWFKLVTFSKLTFMDGDVSKLRIAYTTTGKRPFYELLILSYERVQNSNGSYSIVYHDRAYPRWIMDGDAAYNLSNAQCALYNPSSEAYTIVELSMFIRRYNYIAAIAINQTLDINSMFNNEVFEAIVPELEIEIPATNDLIQSVKVKLNGTGIDYTTFDFKVATGEVDNIVDVYSEWEHIGTEFKSTLATGEINELDITIRTKATFTLDFYRTFIYDKRGLMTPASIKSQDNSKIILSDGYGYIDLNSERLIDASAVSFVSAEMLQSYDLRIYVGINNSAIVYFLPEGIVGRSSNRIVYERIEQYPDEYRVFFMYDGSDHVLHIDTSESAHFLLKYKTTDIRTGVTKEIYSRDLSDCYMFIKQFWSNTVDVEDFWWLDSTHVLCLDKFDIILYEKIDDGSVHDWMGDNWRIIEREPRGSFFVTNDLYYGVSSAYNGRPVLFKLRNNGNKYLQVLYADVLDQTFNFATPRWTIVNIEVKKLTLGTDAPAIDKISAYIELDIDSLISVSKISATYINGVFILGIAYNRGLCQWALKIAGSSVSVLTGYGHVGVNGCLTGGQIPTMVCGSTGFNQIVYPLSLLPDESPSLIQGCFGNESTVWFIYNQVSSIVSHYEYNGGFSPQSIDLNNNVSTRYENVSFGTQSLFQMLPTNLNFAELLMGAGALSNIISVVGPNFITYMPKYTQIAYIGHSLGQFAYVWRNSLQQQIEDEAGSTGSRRKSDQDIGFCKWIRNVTYAAANKRLNVWVDIVLKSLGPLADRAVDAAANRAMNTITTDEAVESFSQFATTNIASSVGSALVTSGYVISIKSTISALYTLSMFYNISDKVQCWAGPGFVNHNLVGQCMAQSVTDTQVEGKQIGYFALFYGLTEMALDLKIRAQEIALELTQTMIAGVGSLSINISPGAGIPIGQGLAYALQATAAAQGAVLAINRAVKDALPSIASSIGGYPSGESYYSGGLSKRDLTMEGTHAYGNKHMSLFWPAYGIVKQNTYTDESVIADVSLDYQKIELGGNGLIHIWDDSNPTLDLNNPIIQNCAGTLWNVFITCRGLSAQKIAPTDMAVVEGVSTFLSPSKFKNTQIGVGNPTFADVPLHDFIIDKDWNLSVLAGGGEIISVNCDDTKIMDGQPSNIVITRTFCGVASAYTAIEVKNLFDAKYLRPVTITPTAVGLNINRINCVHESKAYHAFDGIGNRIVKWTGGSGMDKAYLFQQYLFQVNDHFKRSSILPPSSFFGAFSGPPSVAVRAYDKVANLITSLGKQTGLESGVPGEQKDLQRFSIPVHVEPLSTLPSVIRTLAPYKLHTIEGITSLTTDIRNTQTKYKAPTSVDFNINGNMFRATEEYICQLVMQAGVVGVQDLVASAGLTFIGATTEEAFFYSPATRMYYSFTGSRSLTKRDIFNRFKEITTGRWDFVNQEVMFKCLLGPDVIICRLDKDVLGELYPPNYTIYNNRSDFKLFSVAGGTVYQGPKRFIVSRFITLDHMFDDIRMNKRKWEKLSRDEWYPERNYNWEYTDFEMATPFNAVYGWTHNPFRLATAMLGIDEETDCKFEWMLTFAWTEQMDALFAEREFVTVNIAAETVSQGGTLLSAPTHVFLFKECFTRSGCAGYYTFTFQSNNGIGNRERLYVWSDGIIALEDLTLVCKNITKARTQPLHTQVDVQDHEEL